MGMNKHFGNIESTELWREKNLKTILDRLAPVAQEQDLAKIITSDFQGVFLRRLEDTIELYCYNQETNTLSEIMSRIDLNNPLKPIAEYSKAVLLSAAWQDTPPNRIYIAGMGGGRLSMMFHHLFSNILIDGTDIDPTMIEVCENYFGLHLDGRHDIRVEDSRKDLAKREGLYDVVILDVFFGKGEHPNHLATVEFLQECKSKMSADGVLAVNLVTMDPYYEAKMAAIGEVFPHCLDWDYAGAHVLLASQNPVHLPSLGKRADELLKELDPSFSSEEQIDRIRILDITQLTSPALRD